jgi:hypothetical protein
MRVRISHRAALRGVEGDKLGAAESISQALAHGSPPPLAPRMALKPTSERSRWRDKGSDLARSEGLAPPAF